MKPVHHPASIAAITAASPPNRRSGAIDMRIVRHLCSFHRLLFLAAVVFLAGSVSVHAQHFSVDSLVKKFNVYQEHHLQEKIFLHTDRSFYLTGETMWFRIFYVDGNSNKPLALSKVAYVEIIDRDKKALVQTKVLLRPGGGDGSMFLPASLTSGTYLVRAYTHWMQNFSPDFYFQEFITIVNPFTRLEKATPEEAHYDAQFFPEGGSLIGGITSKIAFRITDTSGKGMDFGGVVLSNKNDTVVHFHPLKFGIGSFTFLPETGVVYRAVVRDKENHPYTFSFPEVRSDGYRIRVVDTLSTKVAVEIIAQSAFSSPDDQFLYLIIHNHQTIKFAEKHYLQSNGSKVLVAGNPLVRATTTMLIDKNKLGDGIAHLTVFDRRGIPVAERLYFQKPEAKLKVDGQPDQSLYPTRKKVTVGLTTAVGENFTPASLSVSVFRIDSLQSTTPVPLDDYLRLTSELAGAIESPGYYLTASGDTARTATDNLMLTHGWSRFRWDEITKGGPFVFDFIPEYRGHLITGRVLHDDGSPGIGVPAYLSSPGKNVRLYPSKGDERGLVKFELKDFFGSRKIVLQTNTEVYLANRIELNNPFSATSSSLPFPPFHLSPAARNPIAQRSLRMQIQNTFSEGKNIRFTAPPVDSTAFYGVPDERYFLDDYTRFPTMEEVLREYVPGVVVRKHAGKFRLLTIDLIGRQLFRDNPLVLLDGVPVFDIDKIISFDPRKVWRLDVLTRRYFLGPLSFQGISIFTTYHGDLSDFELDPRILVLNYEGLQLHKEFYSPRYELEAQQQSRLPDTRSLLYWNPMATTDLKGKGHVEFFTPDVEGKYTIVIQGITPAGIPGSARFVFDVKGAGSY
jgi:hypothetical protein